MAGQLRFRFADAEGERNIQSAPAQYVLARQSADQAVGLDNGREQLEAKVEQHTNVTLTARRQHARGRAAGLQHSAKGV